MNKRTCNHCNQPLIGQQKKYCSHLCANRDSRQAYSNAASVVGQKSCDVEGCEKPARSLTAELCKMHYHRVYRYGSLTPVHAPRYLDITGTRFGTLVATKRLEGQRWSMQCDCGGTRSADLGNLNRAGDASTCGNKTIHYRTAETYGAAHGRVRADKGSASDYPCVDCGDSALHWSYDHSDPDEMRDWSMKGAPWFSMHPRHYEPRCVPCHKRMDLQVAKDRGIMHR